MKILPSVIMEQMDLASREVLPTTDKMGIVVDIREDVYQRVFGVGTQGDATNGFRPLRPSAGVCPRLHQVLLKMANIDLHQNLAVGFRRQIEKIRSYF